MYARREVSSDEPFRPVLRGLRQRLGKEEPAPAQWATAHEGQLQTWAKAIEKDKDLFGFLMNMREFRDQVEFRGDTHTRWLFQGSAALPAGAAETEIDKKLGFGIHRDDLGGGFSEITFIFPKKLSGTALKKAYVRSLLWRQIYTDYGLLATAGGDYEEKQVPEKYEANYAYCGSEAAYDSGVNAYRSKYSFLADLPAAKMPGEKLLDRAHKCIISMCTPEIKIPAKGDDTDFEGPAPASRLAFFQMLARFEKVDVDLAAMRKKSQKSEEELAAEAFLKANKIKR